MCTPLVTELTGISPFGPGGEQHLEQSLADLAVQAGHAVDVATPAHRQVGHVERLVGIGRVAASQGEKGLAGEPRLAQERLGGLGDQAGLEAVEGGFHGRVGREHVARPRGPQRHAEGNLVLFREAPAPGEHGKRRMAFVQVADLDVDPQHSPAAANRRCPAPTPGADASPSRPRRGWP